MTIEVNKYNEAKSLSGICCTVVSDHTRQVSNFCDNFTRSITPIKRVCSEALWPSCGHGVKSTFLLGLPNEFKFCYTRNMNMKQLKYCFIFPPFLSNFAEFDAENWLFCANFGPFWPYLAHLKPVFRIKFSKIGKSQNWNRKIIELPQVSAVRLRVSQNLNSCGSASWEVLFALCPQLGGNGSKCTSLICVAEWAKIIRKIETC